MATGLLAQRYSEGGWEWRLRKRHSVHEQRCHFMPDEAVIGQPFTHGVTPVTSGFFFTQLYEPLKNNLPFMFNAKHYHLRKS